MRSCNERDHNGTNIFYGRREISGRAWSLAQLVCAIQTVMCGLVEKLIFVIELA
jgi:hypothetical protein